MLTLLNMKVFEENCDLSIDDGEDKNEITES